MTTDWFIYADESGIEDSAPFCILGGYMASSRQWKLFKDDWRSVLKRFGVEEFHAKVFFQFNARRYAEPYKNWSDATCERFLAELLEVMHKRQLVSIGSAVDVAAFRTFSDSDRRFLTGATLNTRVTVHEDRSAKLQKWYISSGAPSRPYFVAFQSLMGRAIEMTRPGAKLHFVLDRQNVVESRAVETFHEIWRGEFLEAGDRAPVGFLTDEQRERLGSLAYSAIEEPPLQAADLYCYIWNRILSDAMNSPLLKQAQDGFHKKKTTIRIVQKDDMERVMQDFTRGLWNQLVSNIQSSSVKE